MMHALESFAEKRGTTGLRGILRSMALSGLCLLSAGPRPASAGTVSYSGKVMDGSGKPIPWAFITAPGSDAIVQSGADGAFAFTADVATTLYGDPKPPSPAQPLAPSGAADAVTPIRFLLTGRAASGSHLAPTLLLSPAETTGGRTAHPAQSARSVTISAAAAAADNALPLPPPPPSEKSAAATFTLTVAMARFQTGSFPQAEATAKNLALVLSPSATDTAAYAAEKRLCLDTLNAYRATLGLAPVVRSASLEAFADQGARYDSERDKAHAHFGAFSKGAVPSDAENAIPGWPLKSYKTVAKIVGEGAKMMWAEGPGGGHYENIKGSHTAVGCGIYVTPDGGVWILHDFK
jgi:cysteine-rich secretory family protein